MVIYKSLYEQYTIYKLFPNFSNVNILRSMSDFLTYRHMYDGFRKFIPRMKSYFLGY